MRRITRIFIVVLAFSLLLLLHRPLTPPGLKPRAARRPVTLVFTGDILLAGRVGEAIQKEGASTPFEGVQKVLAGADLAIGNLECALGTTGEAADKEYTFRARPESAEALRAAGIDAVTLANNHSVDYGPGALVETLAALRKHKVAVIGAGKDSAEARRFLLTTAGSPPMKIAVLAFSNMLPTDFYAQRNRAGTNPAWPSRIEADVAAADRQADLVVVLFHWGDELSPTPSKSQRYLAGVAAEAGADLVVGHHPHVLQGMERRGHTLIAYSLGNFVFPSRGAAKETAMLRYTIRPDGTALAEMIPCRIDGFRPRLAAGKDEEQSLLRMRDMSEALGLRMGAEGVVEVARRDGREAEARRHSPPPVDNPNGQP